MSVITTCLGHPRIGVARELKKALEAFWAGKSSEAALAQVASELRRRHFTAMRERGIDQIPSNDFSLYDHVLDMAVSVGAVPRRYREIPAGLPRYFAMARGLQDRASGLDVPALEMTKWFDTNYHYIVPELELEQTFELDASKLLSELEEAKALGIETRPVIVGPVTFLLSSKLAPGAGEASPLVLLDALLPIYAELLAVLAERGVGWVQVDEPCLATDLDAPARSACERAFEHLSKRTKRPRVLLATYFGALGENLPLATGSGFEALHADLCRAPEQLDALLGALGPETALSAGVVDGRNVWRTDLDAAHALLRRAVRALGPERVFVAPSCSLLHVPIDVSVEQKLDPELRGWLAFATQKLDEIRALAGAATSDSPAGTAFDASRAALAARRASPRTRNTAVRSRTQGIDAAMLRRASPYSERAPRQRERFGLPVLPTTTIGSFPQTAEVRGARAAWRAGRITGAQYQAFLETETRRAVEKQEALGLDVFVHGEFERNDMVEYFGEKLEGF
ncbi:MAG TPA: 5-methyltetrahydropteroyltriglutamate--homocysteine S-methyltransferase, partial [Polyangiaceae bacterium]